MYIQVRTFDGKTKIKVDISKTTPVSELKKILASHFNIEPDKQRLFCKGKQLEDGYSLFDYNINLNDMVQIMEKVTVAKLPKENDASTSVSTHVADSSDHSDDKSQLGEPVESSSYFKVGEFIDLKDTSYGAWFEGKITNIYKDNCFEQNKEKFKSDADTGLPYDGYFYEVTCKDNERSESSSTIVTRLTNIRPRTRVKIPYGDLKVGDRILVNYNIEDNNLRGFWYEATVSALKNKKTNVLLAHIIIGSSAELKNCNIVHKDDVMKIEETKELTQREPYLGSEPPLRSFDVPDNCTHCKNNKQRKCKECGCHVCGLKTDENKQVMCDECDYAYHIWCLNPPLEDIPDVQEWYCHECKNDENEIVTAGAKLKESKKKAKMASKQNNSTRDWGKGMACVARTKACTIVPHDHFGPIPGIEVGTLWKFRIQVSEAGVHRPHVAGIHGRETVGAFSVVLSGGYEDDIDNGDEVFYTGSGGRDLSGNKRTNAQGFDQTLSRFNKALAMNCNVPLNEKGAEAKDWRAGKPVRVVRNYKLSKHSKYAPEEGNRYDGIYKVVKYFPKKGKSGFTVWRFLFRRDDPVPAPWTKEGKKRIENLGLEMQYPEGYVESGKVESEAKEDTETIKSNGKRKKRVLEESPNPQPQAGTKKQKCQKYILDADISIAVQKDTQNEKMWDECKEMLDLGKPKFVAKVEETFTCICCTELVCKPITTPCHHNFCMECIKRSFKADIMTCPTCRNSLDKDVLKNANLPLQEALLLIFPGYTAGR